MNFEVIEALGQIAREKNVDKRLVIDTLAAGLVAAVRKKHGTTAEVDVLIDEENRTLGAYLLKNVVDDVEDPVLEASLEEARAYDPDIDVGHVLRIEVPLEGFGRTAIQAVKQVVVQRVREAEREKVYEDYHNKVGEVMTGSVQQVDRGNLVVNLGRTEALLPYREQIPREMYRQGDTIRAIIVDVQKNTKGPQLILSRTHPSFLEQLFRVEVPEVYEGIVEIRAVSREAGLRSKIAVFSNDDRIDPVGACVGMKGSRVQAVVRELSGERIDIIPWSGDPKVFVTRALSPAKVTEIEVDEEEKTMRVSVAEGQLSLAIGKKGQNARLAAKLTGWKIDLVKEEEEEAILTPLREVDESGIPLIGVENLPGVGPRIANKLIQEGFVYVQDLRKTDVEALCQVPGVGEKTAEKILEFAEIMLEEADVAVHGEGDAGEEASGAEETAEEAEQEEVEDSEEPEEYDEPEEPEDSGEPEDLPEEEEEPPEEEGEPEDAPEDEGDGDEEEPEEREKDPAAG